MSLTIKKKKNAEENIRAILISSVCGSWRNKPKQNGKIGEQMKRKTVLMSLWTPRMGVISRTSGMELEDL